MSLLNKSKELAQNLKRNAKKIATMGLMTGLAFLATGCKTISENDAIELMKNEASSKQIEEIVESTQTFDNTISLKSGADVILPEVNQDEVNYDAEAKLYFGELYERAEKTLKIFKNNFVQYFLNCNTDKIVDLDKKPEISNTDTYLNVHDSDNEYLMFFGDKDTNSAMVITQDGSNMIYNRLQALYVNGDRIFVSPDQAELEIAIQFLVVVNIEEKDYLVYVNCDNYRYDVVGENEGSIDGMGYDKKTNLTYYFYQTDNLSQDAFYKAWQEKIIASKQPDLTY